MKIEEKNPRYYQKSQQIPNKLNRKKSTTYNKTEKPKTKRYEKQAEKTDYTQGTLKQLTFQKQ